MVAVKTTLLPPSSLPRPNPRSRSWTWRGKETSPLDTTCAWRRPSCSFPRQEHDLRCVVIFNWLGLPNKNTILQQLVLMVKAGEKVAKRGDGPEPKFGHLVLLMRDVKMSAVDIKALIMNEEDEGDFSLKEAVSIMDRNIIRKGLKAAFKSIDVITMPSPHVDISDGAVPLSEVSPGFAASLGYLRGVIAGHLRNPHTFGGKPITGGERLHDIMGGLCEVVNSTRDICPPSVLATIDTKRGHEEACRALELFDDMLEFITDGDLVRSTRETAKAISDARDGALEQFDHATQETSTRIAEEIRDDLTKQIAIKARVVAGGQETKRREVGVKMQALVNESEAGISQHALGWNAGFSTGMAEGALELKWERLVSSRFRLLKQALKNIVTDDGSVNEDLIKELGWALTRKQFNGLLKDTLRQVQVLNRAAIEREQDRKAKEEADRRAQQLARDNERLQRETREAESRAADARRAANQAREEATSGDNGMMQMMQLQHAMQAHNQMFGRSPYGGHPQYTYYPYGGGFNPFGGYYG
ncbi:unnamed protein product [Scytosiphon promiscuus]